MNSSFNLTAQFKVNEEICVQKYVSAGTGIKIVLAQMKGPLFHASFVVPTQPRSDDGEAHALEHLIFGGSEDYPYKGVIDILANRYLSYGCSAETTKDYTCFKLDIACSRGLYLLLPVYLDHILYPLLHEFTFTTDIYHINGDGREGGVLHTELLSRENNSELLAINETCRTLYKNSGYSYDALGSPELLRSLSVGTIREYHSMYYRPDNLTIFIAGRISPEEVFQAILPIEEKILEKGLCAPFDLQWNTTLDPLEENINKTLFFPSDEGVNGTVYVSWRGPNPISEYNELIACRILLKYFCSGPVSPLQQSLILNCSLGTDIEFEIFEYSEALISVKISGIDLNRIAEVEEKVFEVIQKIVDNEDSLNMNRLNIVIQSFREGELNKLEQEPHLQVFNKIIPTILYADGDNEKCIENRFNLQELTDCLMLKPLDEWMELISKYFLQNYHVTIETIPSIVEQQIATEKEQERLELCHVNSEQNLLRLEEAIKQNDVSPPQELITAAELLANAEVSYHWALRYCSSKQTTPPGIQLQKMPVYTEAYDLSTNFVYITAIFGTDSIPSDLRLYLPLFVQLLTNSPIMIGLDLISLEQLSTTLEEDLCAVKVSVGLQSCEDTLIYFNHFTVLIQVEIDKYDNAPKWLHNILYNTIFEVERVKICALSLLNQITEMKHDSQIVSQQILNALVYEKTSNICLHSMIKQKNFLNSILSEIEDASLSLNVLEHLHILREIMFKGMDKVSLHIATDWSKLHAFGNDLNTPWATVFPETAEQTHKSLYVLPDYIFGQLSDISGIIIGRVSAKTSCLYQAVSCISSYRDIDLAALAVFLQYINQPEGSAWKSLKGKALAYEYSIQSYPNEGLLRLSIAKSNNIFLAYKELRAFIEYQLQGEWNESLVESAKSTCIYNAVNTESTISKLVYESIRTSFNDVPYDQNKVFIKKLQKVTVEQLNAVGEKFISKLFHEDVKTSLICPADQVDEIVDKFENIGITLTHQQYVSESILGQI